MVDGEQRTRNRIALPKDKFFADLLLKCYRILSFVGCQTDKLRASKTARFVEISVTIMVWLERAVLRHADV